MGIPGHPFLAKKEMILTSIKENKGKITRIASSFDVAPSTMRNKINSDPELVQALADARKDYLDLLCDNAEDTLAFALTKRDEDLSNSLKSTFYILNNQGKERGYTPNGDNQKIVDDNFAQKFAGLMGALHNIQKSNKNQRESSSDLNSEESNIISDT